MTCATRLASIACICVAAWLPSKAVAQPSDVAAGHVALGFEDYLNKVGRFNLELAAQRMNIAISEAQVAVARVFPDPTVSAGLAAYDISKRGSPTVTTLGLSQLIELGGKRAARVRAAQTARTATAADTEDFFRVVRANAAGVFVDALSARLELEQKRRSLASLERLVSVNEQRVRAGDIGEVALIKTRVEAQQFKADVLQAEGELQAAELQVALQIGHLDQAVPEPQGELKIAARTFLPSELIAGALANRPDLVARRRFFESAGARVDLAKANRWVDIEVGVGWQHSGPGTQEFAQPAFDALGGTLTIPLPFSRIYRGELQGASASEAQAKVLVNGAESRVQIEVRQAYARYQAATGRVKLYSGGTVADAEHVFDSTMYNYQRGGATLLEVLDAQRTLNEVYLSYFDALRAHARALIELETAAGMWDVRF